MLMKVHSVYSFPDVLAFLRIFGNNDQSGDLEEDLITDNVTLRPGLWMAVQYRVTGG